MVLCPEGIPREELWGLEQCRDVGCHSGGDRDALAPSPAGEDPAGQLGMGSASSGEGRLTIPAVSPTPALPSSSAATYLTYVRPWFPFRAVAMQMAPSMPREFSCRLREAAGSEHRPPARSGSLLPASPRGAGYSLEPAEAPVHLQRVGHRFGPCHADEVSSQAAKEGRPWGRTAWGDPWAPCSPWARGGGGRGSPTSASQGTGKPGRP